jgi:hypothetical protein
MEIIKGALLILLLVFVALGFVEFVHKFRTILRERKNND